MKNSKPAVANKRGSNINHNNAPSRTVKPGRAGKAKAAKKWRIPKAWIPKEVIELCEKAELDTNAVVLECVRRYMAERLGPNEVVELLTVRHTDGDNKILFWRNGECFISGKDENTTLTPAEALEWLADQFASDTHDGIDFEDDFPRFLRTVAGMARKASR